MPVQEPAYGASREWYRDWYAAHALSGLLAGYYRNTPSGICIEQVTAEAIMLADRMIERRFPLTGGEEPGGEEP